MTNENQNPIEYVCYQQLILPENDSPLSDLMRKMNGKIVLLKRNANLGNFVRGQIFYDEKEEPRIAYLEYIRDGKLHRKRIHLHDIEGLLLENPNSS